MQISEYISLILLDFFNYFNIKSDTEQIAALVFGGVYLLALILRIIVSLGYQSKYTMFTITAKEIPNKTDIPKIKGSYLPRILQDYAALGERGVGNIDVENIVEKNLLKSSVIGWKYKSIEGFIEKLEDNVLFVGLISIVLLDSKLFFGIASLCVFALTRLFSSLFDYTVARERLVKDTVFYLCKEMGKFYIADTSNAITKLKLELKSLMTNQAKIIDDSIQKLITELSKSISVSMDTVTNKTDDAIGRLAAQALVVTEPMAKWAQTLDKANIAQELMNKGIENINLSISSITNGANKVDGLLSSFAEKVAANGKNLEEQMTRLVSSISDLKEVSAATNLQAEMVSEDLKFIKSNQAALERAVSQYEVSLKDLTGQMGDAFGKIVDFHIQGTYNALNENIQNNIKQIVNSNNELLERLQALFTQIQLQSKSETETIIRMKEQMDLHFDGLNNTGADYKSKRF